MIDLAHRAPQVKSLLQDLSIYHFHNTSARSALRTHARLVDDQRLASDGGNLAAVLYKLRQSPREASRKAYQRIEWLVRQIAPFIKELRPTATESDTVRLDWIDDRDQVFGCHQLSDGTLRAIALYTALSQPVEQMPAFCTLDEPELGLHPAALDLFAELVRSASQHCQILIATQSPALLDHFQAEEVIVAEREDGATVLRRLDPEALSSWLQDYQLSELYDSNIFGGRP